MRIVFQQLTKVVVLFIAIICSSNAFTQQNEPLALKAEIFFTNNSGYDVILTLNPIGMIFNDKKEYSLTASLDFQFPGKSIGSLTVDVPDGEHLFPVVNHVGTVEPIGISDPVKDRHFGFGKYRLNIRRLEVSDWGFIDVDFSDFDYPFIYSSLGIDRDIWLRLENDGSLYWDGAPDYLLSPDQDLIKIWDQSRIGRPQKNQNKDGFKIISNTNIPLQAPNHITPGQLFVNLEIQANTTVLSGKSFIVQEPGTQILFNSNKQLIVNGKLQAKGTSSAPIIFGRSGTSGNWQGLYINGQSGSYIQNSQIKDCVNAIHVNSGGTMNIYTNDIQATNTGIWISGYGNPRVWNNYIQSQGDADIYCTGGTGIIWDNSLEGSNAEAH